VNIFKVGDKVEITVDYMHAKAGDTLTVIDPDRLGSVYCKHDKSGRDMGGHSWRFKLVQPKYDHNGLKVGDKVRYTPSLWKGMEGTVHAFHEGYVEVMVTKLPDNPNQYSEVVVGKTLNQTVGGLGVSPYSLKKIESRLAEGDKVRYESNGENHEFDGLELTVDKPFAVTGHWVTVTKGNHDSRWTVGKKLTLTTKFLHPILEEPFTYKSIQKGDKIRRTRTYSSGSVEIREGIATDPAFGGYWSDGQFILAYDSDENNKYVTLELLERPEPPKPVKVEPWDTIGTAGVLYRKNSYAEELDTFVKKADGSWVIFYPDGGTYNIGKEEQIKEYFRDSECIAPAVK
jgi:hypothetical protein